MRFEIYYGKFQETSSH